MTEGRVCATYTWRCSLNFIDNELHPLWKNALLSLSSSLLLLLREDTVRLSLRLSLDFPLFFVGRFGGRLSGSEGIRLMEFALR